MLVKIESSAFSDNKSDILMHIYGKFSAFGIL